MAVSWANSLKANATRLENLAAFYGAHGFFVAATLIGAAALEVRENLVARRSPPGKEKS